MKVIKKNHTQKRPFLVQIFVICAQVIMLRQFMTLLYSLLLNLLREVKEKIYVTARKDVCCCKPYTR